jgi:hypothetical protein
MGVSYQLVDDAQTAAIHDEITKGNMEVVPLETAPRIAVYAPPWNEPWDDAVRIALDYAHIPHEVIYDREVLAGRLHQYDWLHLHHEDFTGQYGKFYRNYHTAPWYQARVKNQTALATELGFPSVAALKRAVALSIKDYMSRGGFIFAMCSGTDTLDIALAADGMDIVSPEIDGTPVDIGVNSRLDSSQCLAFENFHVITDAHIYEHSDIDVPLPPGTSLEWNGEYFRLFEFAARIDPIPTMLTQCHTARIPEFRGQCTAFQRERVKKRTVILAQMETSDAVKYLHGNFGEGTFTFYAGHDPEDYAHLVGEEPSDLSLYPNSPGYRLILNNILFPAARPKKLKT